MNNIRNKFRRLLAAFTLGFTLRKGVSLEVEDNTRPKLEAAKELPAWKDDELTLPESVAHAMAGYFKTEVGGYK